MSRDYQPEDHLDLRVPSRGHAPDAHDPPAPAGYLGMAETLFASRKTLGLSNSLCYGSKRPA